MEVDDAYWRQPVAGEVSAEPGTGGSGAPRPAPPSPHDVAAWSAPPQGQPVEPPAPVHPAPTYQPAPHMMAPPSNWRPPLIVEPAPPRRLPGQDHGLIDSDEARARRTTWSVGAVLGVVLLVFLCLLCGQIDLDF